MKCNTCNKDYSPTCDFEQGRCPHHPPYINPHSLRFLNLYNTIKGWFNRERRTN